MKSTPENAVKKACVALLNTEKCYHFPASAGPYSAAGISDRIGVSKGRFFGIEFKKPGGKPTALQLEFKRKVEENGGKWFLVDGVEALRFVLEWLRGEGC